MVDGVKTPTPQWLLDAVHTNTFRADPAPKTRPMPTISPDAVRALMEEIVSVCAKHGLWLAHEDEYHAFMVQRRSTKDWLLGAYSDE